MRSGRSSGRSRRCEHLTITDKDGTSLSFDLTPVNFAEGATAKRLGGTWVLFQIPAGETATSVSVPIGTSLQMAGGVEQVLIQLG